MRSRASTRLRHRRVDLYVLGGAILAVTAVYVVVVLGGGLLIGHTRSPHVGLSVLATAIVALGLEPLRARLEAGARKRVPDGRGTPYDVLSRFSESLSGDIETGERADVPRRMAKLLAEGTGARWAQVWLVVGDEPQLAAGWPPDSAPQRDGWDAGGAGLRSLDVTLGNDRLGVLRLQERRDEPLSPVEERLFADLAAQAGLVLRGARLRAELARRAADLAELADELQASRRRVVDVHDSERRRLERDIHDGAQQHLVALVVNLRLAQTLAARSPERARAVLVEQGEAVDGAISSLVDLSRGIYPKVLTQGGVAAAVRDVVRTSTVPVAVLDHGLGRHEEEVETALYFCCVEAVQNAVKHAGASRVDVEIGRRGEVLQLLVRDDGHGFDVAAVLADGGLGTMRDRVDSVNGALAVRVNDTGGTDVVVTVPVEEI
jgi:signal transduction histidine kinase